MSQKFFELPNFMTQDIRGFSWGSPSISPEIFHFSEKLFSGECYLERFGFWVCWFMLLPLLIGPLRRQEHPPTHTHTLIHTYKTMCSHPYFQSQPSTARFVWAFPLSIFITPFSEGENCVKLLLFPTPRCTLFPLTHFSAISHLPEANLHVHTRARVKSTWSTDICVSSPRWCCCCWLFQPVIS